MKMFFLHRIEKDLQDCPQRSLLFRYRMNVLLIVRDIKYSMFIVVYKGQI